MVGNNKTDLEDGVHLVEDLLCLDGLRLPRALDADHPRDALAARGR